MQLCVKASYWVSVECLARKDCFSFSALPWFVLVEIQKWVVNLLQTHTVTLPFVSKFVYQAVVLQASVQIMAFKVVLRK